MLSNNLGTFVKGRQPSLESPNILSIVKVPVLSLVSQWVELVLMEEVPWTLHSPSIESVPMLVANPSSLGPWPEHCLSAIRTHSYCRSYSALLLCKGVSRKPCLELYCNNWRVEIFSPKFYCVESVMKINHELELWKFRPSTCWSGTDLSLICHLVCIVPWPPWGLRGPRHVSMYGGYRMLLHHSPEAESLNHTVSELVVIKPLESFCLCSPSTGVRGVHTATP